MPAPLESSAPGWGRGELALLRSKLLDAWGHHAPDVLSVMIVAIVSVQLVRPPRILVLPIAGTLAFLVIGSWLLLRRHDRRLCEPCVAALPLDPSRRAERYRYMFSLAHMGSRPVAVAAYMAFLLGSNVLPGVAGRVIWAMAQLSMILLVRSYVMHRRLQPWCPVCRRDGGGDPVLDKPHAPRPSDRQPV